MRLPKGPWGRGSREQLLSHPTLALSAEAGCPSTVSLTPNLFPWASRPCHMASSGHFPSLCLLLLSFPPAFASLKSNCCFCKMGVTVSPEGPQGS